MADDQDMWASALEVAREHGEKAAEFVSDRIRALAFEGDHEGVVRWAGIGLRLQQLKRKQASIRIEPKLDTPAGPQIRLALPRRPC